MLLLAFKRPGDNRFLGPTAAIEFHGGELYLVDGSAPIARYSMGQWLYAGEKWSYLESSSRILIRLEGPGGQSGPVIGPRPSMRLRDRFVFGGRERVATLIPHTACWQVVRTRESWPILRVISDPPLAQDTR